MNPWEPAADDERPGDPLPTHVQRALSDLRTELDAFYDDEDYGLMAAGYLIDTRDFADALPELDEADPSSSLVSSGHSGRLSPR